MENENRRGQTRTSGWVPLLVAVIAFFVGWVARGASSLNQLGSGGQPGVGGGPGGVTSTPNPSVSPGESGNGTGITPTYSISPIPTEAP